MKALFLISLALISYISLSGGTDSSDLETALNARNQSEIMDRVNRVVGLNSFRSIEQIQRVPLSELNIAFITSLLKDKVGFKIKLAPGKINLRPPTTEESKIDVRPDPYVRYISIYLDAKNHHVVAVKSRLATRPPDVKEPSPEVVEKDFGPLGERYGSFPPDDPKTTFMEALETVRAYHFVSPLIAQEIDGFYITYTERKGLKPIPAWLINLRGGFSVPTSSPPDYGPEIVEETRPGFPPTPMPPRRSHSARDDRPMNRIRYIVDANTGRLLVVAAFP